MKLNEVLNILYEESKKKKKEKEKKRKYHFWDGYWLHQNVIDELLGNKNDNGSPSSNGDTGAPSL